MQPIILVTIDVRPCLLAGFLGLVEHHARQSRLEPGCLRFDVLRDLHFPNRFTLHEVFCDGRAVDEHRRTPHYLRWREEIGQYEEAHQRSANEIIDGGAVVFTNGIFDLLHSGHLHLLQQARAQGGRLVVAVNTDASARRLKGPGRPVVTLVERMGLLRALKCVDEVVSFDTEAELLGLIRMIGPDVLAKGDEARDVVGAGIVEATGGRVHLVSLREGRSTTRLIERVLAG